MELDAPASRCGGGAGGGKLPELPASIRVGASEAGVGIGTVPSRRIVPFGAAGTGAGEGFASEAGGFDWTPGPAGGAEEPSGTKVGLSESHSLSIGSLKVSAPRRQAQASA